MATDQNGNAVVDAGLTSEEGQPGSQQDLTEERTVQGLSRTVTKLKQQIAALSASSNIADPEDVTTLKTELERTKTELKRRDIALKYPDVSDFLLKAMTKQKLDPDLIDDEFISAIREGKKTQAPEEEIEVGHNPPRGNLTQDQQDEALLRTLKSLF